MTFPRLLRLGLLAALCSTQGVAGQSGVGLSGTGEVYRIQEGVYGDLFPGASEAEATHPVLALELIRPDGTSERLLVPGTEGPGRTASPTLTIDRATDAVYVVWEGWRHSYPVLHLVTWNADGWSEVVDLSGNPFSFKSNPRLVATADQYPVATPEGEIEYRERTVIHLAWWEEAGPGNQALYTPLVFEEGRFLASNPVFLLSGLLPPDVSSREISLSTGQSPALGMRPGRNAYSVVVSFPDEDTGTQNAVEIQVLSGNVVALADRARAALAELGAAGEAELERLTDRARAVVVEFGYRVVGPEVADYLATKMAADLLASGLRGDTPEGVSQLADRARAVVVEFGARLSPGAGHPSAAHGLRFFEIAAEDPAGVSHLLVFRLASSRPVPPGLDELSLATYLSDTGTELVLAWDEDQAVAYVEGRTEGWGPVQRLRLSDRLSREDAHAALKSRLGMR